MKEEIIKQVLIVVAVEVVRPLAVKAGVLLRDKIASEDKDDLS